MHSLADCFERLRGYLLGTLLWVWPGGSMHNIMDYGGTL